MEGQIVNNQEKMKTQPERFLGNPATLTSEALVDPCFNCNETIYFALRDKDRTFSIGLTTILECLCFAEEQGEIPTLPNEWWNSVKNKYRFR